MRRRAGIQSRQPTDYTDLTDLGLPEDQRIRLAAEFVAEGRTIMVVVEDEAPTVARYQRKLMARGCALLSTTKGPVAGRVTIRVGPSAQGTVQ